MPQQRAYYTKSRPVLTARARESGADCVFLTCFAAEFQVFASLLRSSGIKMHRADTVDQADFLLTVTEATVLLSDTLFLEGTWLDAAHMLANVHPRVELVVVVDEIDDDLRPDAYDSGVFDVVSKPLRMGELFQAILAAHHVAKGAWG